MRFAGRLARFAGAQIQQNPSIAAGSCVFVTAFALVAGNALIGQKGGHPEPIWATRDMVTTRSVPHAHPAQAGPETGNVFVKLPEPVPVPMPRPDQRILAETPVMTVRQVQRELTGLGYYDGEVDGIYGPQTRDAIVMFQREFGLRETGAVDAVLSDALTTAGDLRPSDDDRGLLILPVSVETSQTAALVQPEPAVVSIPEDVRTTALVARIQIGLTNFGETGITIDGSLDPRTQAAIRNFQNRYGLVVNGEPNHDVMAKLEEIGALRAR